MCGLRLYASGDQMSLIDIRQVAALMGRHPTRVWNYHRQSMEIDAGKRKPFKNPMPAPRVVNPQKYWDEDEIQYWIEARQSTRQVRQPPVNMRPSQSRLYPAAARALAAALELNADGGVKREFDVRPDYDNGTVTVALTTRHTLPMHVYKSIVIGSQK